MTGPWKCPDCSEWQAPGVTSHRCAESRPAETPPKDQDEPSAKPPGYSSHMGGQFGVAYQPVIRNDFGFRA